MVTTQHNQKQVKQLSVGSVASAGLDNVLATLGHFGYIAIQSQSSWPSTSSLVPQPVPQKLFEDYLHCGVDAQGSLRKCFLWDTSPESTLATSYAIYLALPGSGSQHKHGWDVHYHPLTPNLDL